MLINQERKLMYKIIIFLLCIVGMMPVRGSFAGMYEYLEPKAANEVVIHGGGIEVPLERILLVRKDTHYCAVKFTRFWTLKDEEEKYAAYEVYYQGDGSGDFSRINVKKSENIASWFPFKGPFRPFIYQPGDCYVECGPFKLVWGYKKKVGFGAPDKGRGDFGFELAPTPWTHISQVNVFDPRVMWYRDDEKRERAFIPVDKLWNVKK
jgi:hypothetical protein